MGGQMMGGPSGPGGMMMQNVSGPHSAPGGSEQQVNPFPFYGHDPSENSECRSWEGPFFLYYGSAHIFPSIATNFINFLTTFISAQFLARVASSDAPSLSRIIRRSSLRV